jgi:serine acetyltransferase
MDCILNNLTIGDHLQVGLQAAVARQVIKGIVYAVVLEQ